MAATDPAAALFELWISGDDLVAERARIAARRLVQHLGLPSAALRIQDAQREAILATHRQVRFTPSLIGTQGDETMRWVGDLDEVPRIAELWLERNARPPDLVRTPRAPWSAAVRGAHARIVVDAQGWIVDGNEAARRLLQREMGESLAGTEFGIPLTTRPLTEVRMSDGRALELRAWPLDAALPCAALVELYDREEDRRHAGEEQRLRGRIALLEARLLGLESAAHKSIAPSDLKATLQFAQARARRSGIPPVGILVAFAPLAERSAQAAGGSTPQEILALAGARIQGMIRPGDRIAQVDTSHLIVVLEDVRPAEARTIAERLLPPLVELEHEIGEQVGVLEPCMAIARLPAFVTEPSDVLNLYSDAIERARADGSRRVVGARAGGPVSDWSRRLDLVLIGEEPLTVEARPIIGLEGRDHRGLGLSVRGPEGPLADPRALFGLALDGGRIIELDLVALETCARVAAEMPAQALLIFRASPITVESAPIEELLLRMAPAAQHAKVLAISDRQITGSPQRLRDAVFALQRADIALAIDDAVPGPAALEAMILLRPSWLRLDAAFVHGLADSVGRRRQLARLRESAVALGVGILADGVDQAADALALSDLGIQLGQGPRLAESRLFPALGGAQSEWNIHHLPELRG